MISKDITDKVRAATISVRRGGRGVLIPGNYILTAAHCIDEWTTNGDMAVAPDDFRQVFFTVDGTELVGSVAFIDPVSDTAILQAVDGQRSPEEETKFLDFCESTDPIPLDSMDPATGEKVGLYIFNQDDEWISGTFQSLTSYESASSQVWMELDSPTRGGDSGSPIINADGFLVGIVSHGMGELSTGDTNGVMPRPHLALSAALVKYILRIQQE